MGVTQGSPASGKPGELLIQKTKTAFQDTDDHRGRGARNYASYFKETLTG